MAQDSSALNDGERGVRLAIQDAAPRNIDLLQTIMTTENAVHAYSNNEARLTHLKKELDVQSKATRQAAAVTQTQLAIYTKEKDSFGRRWAYILAHKRRLLEQKIKETEQVYLQALSAQSKAEQRERKLQQDKEVIDRENVDFLKEAQKHEAAHAELDHLYDQIFDGPTPGFPDEDEKEQIYKANKRKHETNKASLVAITSNSKDLALVLSTLVRAQQEDRAAKYELEIAIFSGVEEALVYLERCARLIEQTLTVIQRTGESPPRPLGADFNQIRQALAKHLSNARSEATAPLGATYVTSAQLFRTIQSVIDELTLAKEAQAELVQLLKGFEGDAKKAVRTTARSLEDSRQVLNEIRQNAFEITVGHGAAAPAYHECCDRAVQFEGAAHQESEAVPDPVIDDSGLPPPPSYEAAVTGNDA